VGIAVAGVSLMLFAVSAAMRARGVGTTRRAPARQPAERGSGQPSQQLPQKSSRAKAQPAVQDKDMDDIEAILRKHGIS
jgi:hypothetical protein